MNADRAVVGLPGFRLRADVSVVSLAHSRAMAAAHSIWHSETYFSAANRSRFAAGAMAENVAMNRSVAAAEVAFMGSPPHRANLLDARMTDVGLGIAVDERGMVYVTQNFIQARGTPIPATTATTATPRPTARPPVGVLSSGATTQPARVQPTTVQPTTVPPTTVPPVTVPPSAAPSTSGSAVVTPDPGSPLELSEPAVRTQAAAPPLQAGDDVPVGLLLLALLLLGGCTAATVAVPPQGRARDGRGREWA